MTKKKDPEDLVGAGRPSDYKHEYAEQARKLCLLGLKDAEIAEYFDIAESTLYLWKNEHPEFSEAMAEGKLRADAEVAQKLYDRACGAEWTEEQAFKVKVGKDEERVEVVEVRRAAPPDTQAASLWLRNRQPGRWRDKQEHEHTGKDGAPLVEQDDAAGRLELARQVAFLLRTAAATPPAAQKDTPAADQRPDKA